MIERQSGSIVISSSTNGLEAGLNYAYYVSAKHGSSG
jgi:NADP-dependent 3-hydroxy acid dehydrogenase YdfG